MADEAFVRKFRGRENGLGAAVQLCTLPSLGYVPHDVAAASAAVVARLSEKLGIPVGELRRYGAREQTRTDHLREITAYLGWRQVDGPRWKDLKEASSDKVDTEIPSPASGSCAASRSTRTRRSQSAHNWP